MTPQDMFDPPWSTSKKRRLALGRQMGRRRAARRALPAEPERSGVWPERLRLKPPWTPAQRRQLIRCFEHWADPSRNQRRTLGALILQRLLHRAWLARATVVWRRTCARSLWSAARAQDEHHRAHAEARRLLRRWFLRFLGWHRLELIACVAAAACERHWHLVQS